MFKNKIAFRLSINFAIALMFFSLVIGSVFMFLFKNHTLNLHKTEMTKRANSIAESMSNYMFNKEKGQKNMGGFGAYLRFVGDIAGTDVWIVDETLNLVTSGMHKGMENKQFNYSDLPKNAEDIINEVFKNKTVFSEEFSEVLSQDTLTVGVPIKNNDNNVIGVVLLHSPIHGTDEAILQGFKLLGISIVVALIISFLLSTIFSYLFTKPLNKMKSNALLLASGDYKAKNHIKQNDEIGQLAETLDILADRLYEASQESEKLEQMRQDFVANISHELRTPVTVIRGSLEALVDHVVNEPEAVEEYHKQMLNEAKSLQRLIGDLLDLSRLQNTNFNIEKMEICIYDVIEDVIRSANQLAEEKNISIKVYIEEKYNRINGDYGRLRQMLMIILHNAIKFSPQDETIEVKFKDNILIIEDHGAGISKDDLPYIFDRFYKVTSEQNKDGTGLGLAIAKQIAYHHGITISVESQIGKGTKFIFKI